MLNMLDKFGIGIEFNWVGGDNPSRVFGIVLNDFVVFEIMASPADYELNTHAVFGITVMGLSIYRLWGQPYPEDEDDVYNGGA
ncbi:MAG: hypothetical protein CUN56_08870 [Phototrophicales bacterium]|nr:MAG: hypothetical protein CUN56_08870 [Phototrophicales bacterium]